MSKLIIPKLTTAIRLSYTPATSELLYDYELERVFIGDNVTPGGIPVGSGAAGLENLDGGTPSSVYTIDSIDGGGI